MHVRTHTHTQSYTQTQYVNTNTPNAHYDALKYHIAGYFGPKIFEQESINQFWWF